MERSKSKSQPNVDRSDVCAIRARLHHMLEKYRSVTAVSREMYLERFQCIRLYKELQWNVVTFINWLNIRRTASEIHKDNTYSHTFTHIHTHSLSIDRIFSTISCVLDHSSLFITEGSRSSSVLFQLLIFSYSPKTRAISCACT